MKQRAFLLVLVSIAAVTAIARWTAVPDAAEGRPKVTLAGVVWENSLADALARAREEGKPVLHLQMFGSLEAEFC
jgi:hypothetical protein